MEHPVAAVAWFLDPPRREAALGSILTHSPSPAGARAALTRLSLAFLQSYDEEISKTLVLSGIVLWKREEKRSEMPWSRQADFISGQTEPMQYVIRRAKHMNLAQWGMIHVA